MLADWPPEFATLDAESGWYRRLHTQLASAPLSRRTVTFEAIPSIRSHNISVSSNLKLQTVPEWNERI